MVEIKLTNGKKIDITYSSIIKMYAIGWITFMAIIFVFYLLFLI